MSFVARRLPSASYRVPTVSKSPALSAFTPPPAANSKRNQSSSSPGSISPAVSLGSSTSVAEPRSSPWSSAWASGPRAKTPASSVRPTRRVGAATRRRNGRFASRSSALPAAAGATTERWQRSAASLLAHCVVAGGGGGGVEFHAQLHVGARRQGASANIRHRGQRSFTHGQHPFPEQSRNLSDAPTVCQMHPKCSSYFR